jgi:hypothetical protein
LTCRLHIGQTTMVSDQASQLAEACVAMLQ